MIKSLSRYPGMIGTHTMFYGKAVGILEAGFMYNLICPIIQEVHNSDGILLQTAVFNMQDIIWTISRF